MKKLFLFTLLTALTFSVSSCSDDDNNTSNNNNNNNETTGTFTFKVDGVAKNFDAIVVNEEVENEGTEDESVLLTVTASKTGNLAEVISFYIYKGDLGPYAIYNFTYTANGHTYYDNTSSLTTVTQTNNNNNELKGAFSGSLLYWDNNTQQESEVALTEGTFDIKYVAN